jgi:bisanhydrobacterioruberin hydratase
MMRNIFQRLALILFCIYLAVFPGSTIVVALDRVPGWGVWMGGALLLLQGGAALCWLVGRHGARGGLAALLVFLLAWAVEHVGVISGVPFGRYHYTGTLQPQLLGIVPLAIPCAWLMVAAGAWQLARTDDRRPTTDHRLLSTVVSRRWSVVVAATLVLLLDLQIETVATKINRYWIWQDGGTYYGVPTANFVAWWLIGLVMAMVVATVLGRRGDAETGRQETGDRRQETGALISRLTSHVSRLKLHVSHRLPAYLYLLSTLMFAIINLAHGYTVSGLVGVFVLFVVFSRQRSISTRRRGGPEMGRWGEIDV